MSADRFSEVVSLVLGFEGGYSNNPNDRGGATNLGITAGTLAAAYRDGLVKHNDVKRLTRDEAIAIYQARYWNACKCEKMPKPLDALVFDMAVNHGCGGAGKILQRTLNAVMGKHLTEDGSIGPGTLKSLEKYMSMGSAATLARQILLFRVKFYIDIVNRSPKQKTFFWGWLRVRVGELGKKLEVF